MADYDILGNIAIIKSERKSEEEKIKEAEGLLKKPGVKTVLEKLGNVKGRLRTIKTKHVLGEETLIALLKENACLFKLNVKTCYFSPRLSNERQLISEKIKKTDRVLVMFAGVGAYPIVINKYKRPKKIIAVEIGKECCRYFKENLKLNKMNSFEIEIIQGDVKKKINKEFIDKFGKFDAVIMARPNLKESFLKYGLMACKKRTRLFYYGFCNDDEVDEMINKLKIEADTLKRKMKIINYKQAGEIAPYKHRYRVEIDVLN